MTTTTNKIFRFFLIFLPIFVAIILGHFIFISSLYYDEINPLAFVYNTVHFPGITRIIRELFSYHHEHILFFVKIVFFTNYLFHQAVDLKEIIYFGILLFSFFLYRIRLHFKLTVHEATLLSLIVFLPMFWDIYLNPLSIQNIFVLIFVIESLQKLRENKIRLSAFMMICSFLSSAQGLLLLPIWLFFAFRKKARLLELIIPTLFAILMFTQKPSDNLALATNPLIELSKQHKMKLLWTFLSPPFNKSNLLIQLFSFIFLMIISSYFIKTAWKEKLNFKGENYHELTIGLLIWCAGCLLSSFFLRLIMENRYFLYSSLIFYILLFFFIRKFSNNSERLTSVLISVFLVHFTFNLYDAIPSLKNLYMERRLNYLNYKFNYMANYFPTDEIRNRAKDIQQGKIDLFKEQLFEIPSGITGGKTSHLKIYNSFIPISLQLINYDEKKDLKLFIKNLEIRKSFSLTNEPAKSLRRLIKIKVQGKSILDVYYLKLKFNQSNYFIQLVEDSNHFHSAEIYSNQIPYGKFDISFIRGTLTRNPSNIFLN